MNSNTAGIAAERPQRNPDIWSCAITEQVSLNLADGATC